MPLQNRVDPFGNTHAVAARGTVMGNRGGRIHDPATKTLNRRYASKRWIACVCAFRGRRRQVMGPGYTELFFLDEVTAFAGGHRPCSECRRVDFVRFTEAWREAFCVTGRRIADEIDAALHQERITQTRRSAILSNNLALPNGTMIARGDQAFAVRSDRLLPWSFDGYAPPSPVDGSLALLTPPSIVKVFQIGYVPIFHPSADL